MLALVVQPVIELVLTGLNRIKSPQPALKEQRRASEKLGHREVVLVITYVWIRLSLTHTGPVKSLRVYVEYVYIHTCLQNVVNSTSNPLYTLTCCLFLQLHCGTPLLSGPCSQLSNNIIWVTLFFALTTKTKTIPLSLTHKCSKKHTLARKAKG